jgi:hypothetical protein
MTDAPEPAHAKPDPADKKTQSLCQPELQHEVLDWDGPRLVSCADYQRYVESASWYAKQRDELAALRARLEAADRLADAVRKGVQEWRWPDKGNIAEIRNCQGAYDALRGAER